MSNTSPHATVKRTPLSVHKAAAGVQTVQAILTAGAASLRVYECAVAGVTDGNAATIAAAGLEPRDAATPRAALGSVTEVQGKPGEREREAILAWPAAKGATGYAVEVSFTPESPDGTWTALANGLRRRRVITAPAPRAKLLARVAAVDAQGTRSAWSPPILVTAR